MLRNILAAMLAIIAMPAHATDYVRYQASGPASGIFQIYDGSDPVVFTGAIYVDAWFPVESMMGFRCAEPLVCDVAGNRVIGADYNWSTYGSFELTFDHVLDDLPLTNAGFTGGAALGNVAGLSYFYGSGYGEGPLTSLTVSVHTDVTRGPSVSVWVIPWSAIPEPATWAMLLAGFGLVGGSLRRRAQAVACLA